MKILPLKFIFILSFAFVFAIQANAQLCGQYTTVLQIKTVEDKPIETAVVQLVPIEKDETKGKTFVRDEKDFSKFSITFFEGHQLTANYKLIISADGFETLEKEIKLPHCKKQNFNIQLIKTIVSGISKSRFCGTITDEQGAVIPKVTLEGRSSKENEFKIVTDSNGNFDAEIFDGLYKILIKADGFKKKVIKNVLLPYDPRNCIQLELKSSVPPHQIT